MFYKKIFFELIDFCVGLFDWLFNTDVRLRIAQHFEQQTANGLQLISKSHYSSNIVQQQKVPERCECGRSAMVVERAVAPARQRVATMLMRYS